MVAQILAVIIFLAMFVLIVLEVWERHIITLGCGLLTLVLVFGLGMHSMSAVLETLNLGSFFTSHFWYTAGQSAEASSGINWETIVFVAGMMIMVEGMARVGFFRWLCMRLTGTQFLVEYQIEIQYDHNQGNACDHTGIGQEIREGISQGSTDDDIGGISAHGSGSSQIRTEHFCQNHRHRIEFQQL